MAYYRHAHQFAAELGSTEDQVHFRLFMVRESWLAGEPEAARAELALARPDAERMGLPEMTAFAAYTAGDLARLAGEYETARAALTQALEPWPASRTYPSRSTPSPPPRSVTWPALRVDLDAARELHAEALAAARASADAPVIAEALGWAGRPGPARGRPGAIRRAARSQHGDQGSPGPFGHSRTWPSRRRPVPCSATPAYGHAYERGQCVTLDTLAALVSLYARRLNARTASGANTSVNAAA